MSDTDPVKQVIVIRKDLKMRRGKEIAQGAHAAMKWLVDKVFAPDSVGVPGRLGLSGVEYMWLAGSSTKVTVTVDSEAELWAVVDQALKAGIQVSVVTDAGKTEFHGIPTHTCAALGPDLTSKLDPITGHLKLY